ncbi:hypothetical protein [Bordetella sp. 02P26C-1]|uniref:hypothetical protein n=1 Tax=Bordetella sp. 02P26C-1 TaxID=2683195 RepID=UPI001352BA05|nr:hypothetical protein [Bordetella sp. 02P26C-1]MVW79556.1 hypothetical protein [Bordetella sp. 02P26C-1]
MQPSRRAFLFGRQRPRTRWEAFVQGLERGVEGRVRHDANQPGRATLIPAHRADARHARALCAEFGVRLRLMSWADDRLNKRGALSDHEDGAFNKTGAGAFDLNPVESERLSQQIDGPVLSMDTRLLTGMSPGAIAGHVIAEPGCRLGDLVAAGLSQFRDAPPDCSVGVWLATAYDWRPGATAESGVVAIDVLLSDGTMETLGPFGECDSRPLRSATVQKLIPFLFQLAAGADARACRSADVWPCRYRLDAMLPAAPAEVNLAHLLLGHHGELAWVEAVTLVVSEEVWSSVSSHTDAVPSAHREAPETIAMAQRLQRQIKDAFDPSGLFLDLGAGV